MKRGIAALAAFLLCGIMAAQAMAAETLYELAEYRQISKGVTYEGRKTATTEGLLDINILRMPVSDPYIKLRPIESKTEYGLRETLTDLLGANGAIAGANASFFGTSSGYAAPFGSIAKDGKLISVSAEHNSDGSSFATFVMGESGNSYMSFLKTGIRFINDGKENMEVHSVNKITDMVFPVAVTKEAMADTSALDARFPGLYKVMVNTGFIVRLTTDTVRIPENGFVVLIQKASTDYYSRFFKVGQSASLVVSTPGIDYAKVQAAIGGGGILVRDGAAVSEGTVVAGRQPRTAIGVNKENTQIIIAEVDGRTHSIGMTPQEMSSLMISLGAYQAMNLDGGGSSTMAIRGLDGSYSVVNTPSDAVQRKIINAAGIFESAPIGALAYLDVKVPSPVLVGRPFKLGVTGLDEYGHPVFLDESLLNITYDDPLGAWSQGYFAPSKEGLLGYTVSYNGAYAKSGKIVAELLSEAKANVKEVRLLPGGTQELSFTVAGNSGTSMAAPSSPSFRVEPESLGRIEEGTFIAEAEGAGYIQCAVAGLSLYIPAYIGHMETVTGEDGIAFDKTVYPELTIEAPLSTKAKDPWQDWLGQDAPEGSFDIALLGNTMIRDGDAPENADSVKEAVLANFLKSSRALFVGANDYPDPETPFYRWNSSYARHAQGDVAILQMSAANGTLYGSNQDQWRNFVNDSKFAKFVIVELDLNPFNFSQKKEFELFHNALKTLRDGNRQVIVVSVQGTSTTAATKDGIRYINLGRLWTDSNELNPSFSILRLRFNGNNMQYELQPVF
jgi:exopolysaccharide biosynthesis protein